MVHSTYFARAPVVERVLGVQFQPIAGLHSGVIGAFWQSLGHDWPTASDAAPVTMQSELFGDAARSPFQLPFLFGASQGSRLQILNRTGDRMIQVQNGRFHFNWKGTSGEGYVRFGTILEEFDIYLRKFVDFVVSQAGGVFLPNQWEVTYLNHIPRGTVWQSPSDWQNLFSSVVNLPSPDGPILLESFAGSWHYEIPPRQGRLHVEVSIARNETWSPNELLVFTLTARGPIDREPENRKELFKRLNVGSDAIVWAFEALTSKEAHTYWGIQNEAT
jgi:uncharacterized protein (TIGR04255 family)